jgi:hypothetical protein
MTCRSFQVKPYLEGQDHLGGQLPGNIAKHRPIIQTETCYHVQTYLCVARCFDLFKWDAVSPSSHRGQEQVLSSSLPSLSASCPPAHLGSSLCQRHLRLSSVRTPACSDWSLQYSHHCGIGLYDLSLMNGKIHVSLAKGAMGYLC